MASFKWTLFLSISLFLNSCISKEPLNAECDITEASLPGVDLTREPIITNDKVTFIVKSGTNVRNMSPEFELTPGAEINPPSGTALDFSSPQRYVVTSEDRQQHKVYTVAVQAGNTVNLNYDFENVRLVSKSSYSYDVFYEISANGSEIFSWASGNAGFALTGLGKTPETFPTYQGENGVTGKCAVMETHTTGAFGKIGKKPMAAGSIFIGKFDVTNALSRPLQATQFGMPFFNEPKILEGYFKYTPGPVYYKADGGDLIEVPDKKDACSIQAVFFEVTPGMEMLDGSNLASEDNPNIIATARLITGEPTEEWTKFSIPFVTRSGKYLDKDKLREGGYSITIVCSSSVDGDYFSGAIGSKLQIDEMSLVCDDVENQ